MSDSLTTPPHRSVACAATRAPQPNPQTQKKRKIAFALLMGIVTTGIISFAILSINLGFSEGFAIKWLRSWGTGYVIVIPAILVIGPRLQALIDRYFQ